MPLRSFTLTAAAIVKRLELSRSAAYRQLFVDLAPILVSFQQDGAPVGGGEHLLAPYGGMLETAVRLLARDREAQPGSSRRLLRLPRGCRLGKLHFFPLLQLAKLLGNSETEHVQFEALPRTRKQLFAHLLGRIALRHYGEEPPCFSTLFGFSVTEYAAYLYQLRRDDPVLFAMLMANEFSLAQEWAREHRPDDDTWVNRGATLGELERLVEIVSFIKNHPESLAQLREAVRILAKGSATRCSAAKLKEYRRLQPYIDQLGLSVEALRALFLGDRAGPPLAEQADWSSSTPETRRVPE